MGEDKSASPQETTSSLDQAAAEAWERRAAEIHAFLMTLPVPRSLGR